MTYGIGLLTLTSAVYLKPVLSRSLTPPATVTSAALRTHHSSFSCHPHPDYRAPDKPKTPAPLRPFRAGSLLHRGNNSRAPTLGRRPLSTSLTTSRLCLSAAVLAAAAAVTAAEEEAAAAAARKTPAPATSSTSSSAASASCPAAMEVVRVPCLSDNYVWLLHEAASGLTAVVDPAEDETVVQELAKRGWTPNFILNTHHHHDHVGANLQLKRRFPGLTIVGPRADWQRIPGIDVQVGDGDTWRLGSLEFRVFDTPGHTRGHITYWVPQAEALFPGDTLFALGCGRLFEGSPAQMWSSLSKLLPLPDATRVFCAHEYTASNARFAATVDPGNAALAERKAAVNAARARGEATVPSLLGEEKATNPFLRPHDPAIRKQLGFDGGAEDWEVFGAIRAAKDSFR